MNSHRQTRGIRCIARRLGAASAGIALTTLAMLGASTAHAQDTRSWTTIGASGAVTPAQQSMVEHSINWARIPFGMASGAALLRYNITAVDGLFPPGFGVKTFAFGARYIDNGNAGRVRWLLRSYNHDSGTLTTIANIDSDDFPQSASAQDNFQCVAHSFDFSENSYFAEVQLSKSALAGRSQVGSLRLTPTACIVAP